MANNSAKQNRMNSAQINEYFVRVYAEFNKKVCEKTLLLLVQNGAIKPVFVRKWAAWSYYNEARKRGTKQYPAYNETADFIGLESGEAVRYLIKSFNFKD